MLRTLIHRLFSDTGQVEPDPNFKQTVLLLHGNGTNGAQNNTFLDSSTNNFTITRNGNTTQGTFSPFSVGAGEWSNYFDGNGDYLGLGTPVVAATGNFTIEGWINISSLTTRREIIFQNDTLNSQDGRLLISVSTSGLLEAFIGGTGSPGTISSTTVIAVNTWYHFAYVRNSNVFTLYINGVQEGATPSSSISVNQNNTLIGFNPLQAVYWHGYLSNIRILNGTALYTTNFTPSTTPLTAITNTSLLTCQSNRFVDNSTNAFAITRNGDVRVTPFSPFAPTAAYSAGTNGGSGYFDGSGDVLSASSNAAFGFGTGNFCVEFWIYPTALTTARGLYATSDTLGLYLYTNTTNKVVVRSWATADLITSNDAVLINTWTHIAVCRSGTTLSLYINGSRTAGGTATNSTNFAQAALYIGAEVSSFYYAGYIAGLIAVKGSAVYDPTQTTITIPTSPPTNITNTSLLLNFTNAGIFDNTGKNNLETVGNAQIDTTTKKFGTGSMKFDGSGDYLIAPNTPETDIGGANFTVECWVYITNLSGNTYHSVFGKRNGSPGLTLGIRSTGSLFAWNGTTEVTSSGITIQNNTWYYIAWTVSGSTLRMFINGTIYYSNSYTFSSNTNRFTIGASLGLSGPAPADYLYGYIDDLRITKGVARYTANFTPPETPYQDS